MTGLACLQSPLSMSFFFFFKKKPERSGRVTCTILTLTSHNSQAHTGPHTLSLSTPPPSHSL